STSLTYAELDARANRLARLLTARGTGPAGPAGPFLPPYPHVGAVRLAARFVVPASHPGE
ncbi:hypothetical protein ABT247_32740, partial [Kitasatospora sp. NPDC001539]|uniref:hypothetical protein n=1 Tax=Kitasatospora sp. NPDC001539 TaxID=3154384 RepID=UPI00331D7BCC